ncbi:MAG: nucleoside hydrolase, partial [Anaerolineae bacterium]|nr:nucleoside hydrolase [Anaerolineae bacterium]
MLRRLLALAMTGLLLAGCATPAGQIGTAPRPSADEPGIERTPVIIDTDMSADDWVAILYLLSHPAAEVRAITVSGTGVAHCNGGVRNALGLVVLAGQPDIPVSCGPETPTDGGNLFPEPWRDNADAMYGIDLPDNPTPPAGAAAPDLLIALSTELEEKPVLVALGPMTNLALALQSDPGFAGRIERIVAMGGAFEVPGNVGDSNPGDLNTVAEWNIYCDPEAADSVVRSGIPITFVPLDATNDVPVRMKFFTAL